MDTIIEVSNFTWNDNLSRIAQEDFSLIQKDFILWNLSKYWNGTC